jgi:tetratricopeptide (TPR) repeat protein
MTDYDDRFAEITQCYEKIVPIALERKIELDVVYAYACFLNEQNRNGKRIIELLVKLEKIYAEIGESEQRTSRVASLFSIAYDNQNNFARAEEYYLKAIAISEALASANPERFNPDLAGSYNNAGIFYKNQGQPQKAEEYYLKAIAIREALASANPERFNPVLADSYNNAGNFYKNQGQPQKVEEYYFEAMAIREALASENPERFNPDLATSYFNYAIYKDNDIYYFKKAYDLALTRPDHPMCRQIIARLSKKIGN